MVAVNKIIKSRILPERSYLYFKYPQLEKDRSIEFYFPFMENIEITESQRANLGVYDLVGRSGNLFTYQGAKSREFSLRFNITLPNVLDYMTNVGLNSQFSDSFRFFFSERDEEKRRMLRKDNDGFREANVLRWPYDAYSKSSFDAFYKERHPPTGADLVLQGIANWVSETLGSFEKFLGLSKPPQPKSVINYFLLLINVIRTSTINNSTNTSLGPPMIYINHGTMYNNIPCVCSNYSINIVNNAGYDLKSLSPRQIQITMNLSENRTGNFGGFVPFEPVFSINEDPLTSSENIYGWESLINEGTLDPHNSTFGEYSRDVAYNKEQERLEEIERINQESIAFLEEIEGQSPDI
jgi:hypothetical protein